MGISPDSHAILAGVLTQLFVEKALQTVQSATIFLDAWEVTSRDDFLKYHLTFCEKRGLGYWVELVSVALFYSLLTLIKSTDKRIRRAFTVLLALIILNFSVCDFGFYAIVCTLQGSRPTVFLNGINPANLSVMITLIVLGISPIVVLTVSLCRGRKRGDISRSSSDGFIDTTYPELVNIRSESPFSDRWAVQSQYPRRQLG